MPVPARASLPTVPPSEPDTAERRAVWAARSITVAPTETSGISASNVITQSHSHGPTPTPKLKSDRQSKTPVGLIWGVAVAIVVAIVALFLVRWMFVRRARKRAAAGAGAAAGGVRPGAGLDAGAVGAGGKRGPGAGKMSMEGKTDLAHAPGPQHQYTYPSPPPPPPSSGYQYPQAGEQDAVELRNVSYPPAPSSPQRTGSAWNAPFSPPRGSEPGPSSSADERQAWLSAEIRATQARLEQLQSGSGSMDGNERKALRERIYELEQRQGSAWALGLE
ncbi:hypothetical protein HMN09_00480500 [Mycena chlorophos]|uniref:Transmembrane protein n=1 Tax=Mycena chlorophos TaxID=658473 RepID=A0A8H6TGU9_MYCCL|nr:hypothetical protein HMN09_00480500 [Mycena chlorophos]